MPLTASLSELRYCVCVGVCFQETPTVNIWGSTYLNKTKQLCLELSVTMNGK